MAKKSTISVVNDNENIVEISSEPVEKERYIEKEPDEPGVVIEQKELVVEESIRIQQAQWVRRQVENQREAEDETRRLLEEEARILDEMRRSTREHMDRTRELHKYNEDCREQMREQVYALNGLSDDQLYGMREYKNAYYRGISLTAFVLSAVFTAFCGYMEGLDNELTMFMLAFTAIQGALLAQEGKRGRLLKGIFRFFNLLMLPAMAFMFASYELELFAPEVLFSVLVPAGGGILFLATLGYFVDNPYRGAGKRVRSAESDLKEIEQQAEKAVKRNAKLRRKQDARLARIQRREEARRERLKHREQVKLGRMKKREETRMLKKAQKQELQQAKLAKKEDGRKLWQKRRGEMKTFLLEKREEIKLRWKPEKASDAAEDKLEAVRDMQDGQAKAEDGKSKLAEALEAGQEKAVKDMPEEQAKAAGDVEAGQEKAAKDMPEEQAKAAGDSEDKETGEKKETGNGGIKIMDAAQIVPVEKK